MKYSLEMLTDDGDVTIVVKNLDLETLQEFSKKESIDRILSEKYYIYGIYDKFEMLGNRFMILKQSKKNVVMVRVGN